MSPKPIRYARLPRLPLATALAALLIAPPVFASGKPDKPPVLLQKMEQASQRYQQAQVELANGDETAATRMGTALEDIEDLATQCLKQKGCEVGKVLTVYETLLKRHDLAPDSQEELGDDHASPVLAASPEAKRTLSMLPNDAHGFDRMVEMNEPIQAAIKDWLTQQRAFLIDAWENYQYMRFLMAPEYEKAGLPEALLFGIMAKESGGKVHSVSRAGASGPLQFMSATGYRFGLFRDGSGFDWRFDPQASARANAAYINERFAELNRNLEFTVAAYNGGEGRALRLYNQNAGRSFWNPDVYYTLPAETRDYVPKVIAAAWLFLHPKQYGLEFPKIDTTPAQFNLLRPASISELTICMGNSGTRDGFFRVLRNLNPQYGHDEVIPAGRFLRAPKRAADAYQKHCTQGPRAQLATTLVTASPVVRAVAAVSTPNANPLTQLDSSSASDTPSNGSADTTPVLATVPVVERKPAKTYKVRRGDNLMAIAREHNCDLTELAKANALRAPSYTIQPGQKLKLQGCDG